MSVFDWCLTWLSPDWYASKKEQARLDRECERQELRDEIEELKAEIEVLKDG
jgi:hypothetical protein